jgi:hypothetical protein
MQQIKTIFKLIAQNSIIYAMVILFSLLLHPVTALADVGQSVSTLIDSLYAQLSPIINSLAILGIGLGAVTFITAGGNVDKRTLGRRIFFGALGGILIYNIAPGLVKWASTNLTIKF